MALSESAQVAKRCKGYCKSINIECTVVSDSSVIGGLVNVTVFDQCPAIIAGLDEFFTVYQSGHFDGMQDLYIESNLLDDVPQVHYLFVNSDYTADLYQDAWRLVKTTYDGAKKFSGMYSTIPGGAMINGTDKTVSAVVHGILSGSIQSEFWNIHKAKAEAALFDDAKKHAGKKLVGELSHYCSSFVKDDLLYGEGVTAIQKLDNLSLIDKELFDDGEDYGDLHTMYLIIHQEMKAHFDIKTQAVDHIYKTIEKLHSHYGLSDQTDCPF